MKPGIYSIISDKYHADDIGLAVPSLSNSIAKVLIGQSPRHAWMQHPKLNPSYKPDEDSKFDLGSAAHAYLLEGEDKMHVVDADDWRTKAAKEERDQARLDGFFPLLKKQADDVKLMAAEARQAVFDCPDLGCALQDGDAEQTVVWQDGETWCRSRPDWMRKDRKIILDYKTTTSANPDDFALQIVRMGYDIQAAFYTRGIQAVTGVDAKFVFLVQETEPPYICSFVGMPPAYMALGEDKALTAIRLWADCLKKNKWPAYSNKIYWAEPPAWAASKWIERSEQVDYSDQA
jgi:hypothetical protein